MPNDRLPNRAKRPVVAPSPRPTSTPWLIVVADLRAEAEAASAAYRLAALRSLPYWREVVLGFISTAGFLSADPPKVELLNASSMTYDDRLVWSWEQVDDRLDSIVSAIDERSVLSSFQVVDTFESLRAGSIIFPDGSAHRSALRLAGLEATATEAELNARIASGMIAARSAAKGVP